MDDLEFKGQITQTVPVINQATGERADLPLEQLEQGLQSPNLGIKKSVSIPVISPDGQAGTVPGEEIQAALQSGYKLETPKEQDDRLLQKDSGDALTAITNLGPSFLRGATFGATDIALAGVTPEAQADLRRAKAANPISSTVAEVAGAIFSPVTKFFAPAIEAKMAASLAGAAQKAGVTGKVATSIASKIAPAAVGGAVEGALLSTGQLISEDALGTAQFNAENLAAAVGHGALLGGAFGGALSSAIAGAQGLAKAAKPALNPGIEFLSQLTNREKAASELIGLTPAKVAKLEAKNPAFIKDLPDFLKNEAGLTAKSTSEDLLSNVERLKKTSGEEIGNILKQLDAAPTAQQISKKELYDGLENHLFKKFEDTLNSSSPEAKSIQNKILDYVKNIEVAAKEPGALNLQAIHRNRMIADDLAFAESGFAGNSQLAKIAREARSYYNDTLKKQIANQTDELTNIMYPDGSLLRPSSGLDLFEKANKNYSMSTQVQRYLAPKAAKSEMPSTLLGAVIGAGGAELLGDVSGSAGVGALAGILGSKFLRSDLRARLAVLGKIEQANLAVQKSANSIADRFTKVSELRPVSRALVLSTSDSAYSKDEKGRSSSNPQKAYDNISKNLNQAAADPEKFLERLTRQNMPVYTAAPNTSSILDTTLLNGALFLHNKLPKSSKQPNLLTPTTQIYQPTGLEKARFMRYVTAVENPKTSLKNIANGTVSPEEIEALKVVYPSMFKQLQEQVLSKVQGSEDMPYNKKVELGLLFGVPTDSSLNSETIRNLQSNFTSQNAPDNGSQPAVAPTLGGAAKLDVAGRAESFTESVGSDET